VGSGYGFQKYTNTINAVEYIEALMDKEEDEECLYLLGILLKLALSRQQNCNSYI